MTLHDPKSTIPPSRAIDYDSTDKRVIDWHKLISICVMIGSATAGFVICLWAIYIPRANPMLIFPLLGCILTYAIGSVWWLLNRKGLL